MIFILVEVEARERLTAVHRFREWYKGSLIYTHISHAYHTFRRCDLIICKITLLLVYNVYLR